MDYQRQKGDQPNFPSSKFSKDETAEEVTIEVILKRDTDGTEKFIQRQKLGVES